MERYRVDEIDLALQARLRDDGRLSFSELGHDVGLSADAVRARVGRLVGDGVMRIIGAVHPHTLGYFALAAAWLSYPGKVADLARQLSRLPNVTYMTEVLGPDNLLLEIAGVDDDELVETLREITGVNPDIRVRDMSRILEYHKWHSEGRPARPDAEPAAPIPHEQLTASDIMLLRALVQNPRASYRTLSEDLGESYWNVRRRVQQLFATRTIRATAVFDRAATGHMVIGTIGLRLAGEVDQTLREVSAMSEVNIVSWQTGRFNAFAEFACRDHADVGRLTRAIASLPGVADTQVWLYVRTHIAAMPWMLEDSVTVT